MMKGLLMDTRRRYVRLIRIAIPLIVEMFVDAIMVFYIVSFYVSIYDHIRTGKANLVERILAIIPICAIIFLSRIIKYKNQSVYGALELSIAIAGVWKALDWTNHSPPSPLYILIGVLASVMALSNGVINVFQGLVLSSQGKRRYI